MALPTQELDLSPVGWGLAWERQIVLEILRDTEPTQEISILLERLHHREIRKVQPAFPSPEQLAAAAASRTDAWNRSELEGFLTAILEKELVESISILQSDGPAALCERLELLIEPEILFRSSSGEWIASNTDTEHWGMWYPGLENDRSTLRSVLETLPGVSTVAIPTEVRWLEDPSSSIALPGAVSLAWHDAIHIFLGRGLLDQDEAFVVGFAMGNSSHFRSQDAVVLRDAFAHSYPEPFRVQGLKLAAFNLGIEAGRSLGMPDLSQREGVLSLDEPLGRWRETLGISKEMLRPFYVRESCAIPRTLESARLPF